MYSFQPPTDEITATEESKPAFYSLWAIITFILIPPLWFLSVPALVFSSEAKALYNSGNFDLAQRFSLKTKKFLISAWLVFLIVAMSATLLYFIQHLSLI